jgi:hypothetical protein
VKKGKTMKNLLKSLVASAALLLASSVSAGTLYWQVQPDDNVPEFDEAWLMIENKTTGDKQELAIVASQSDKRSTALTQTSLDSLADPDAYLYYVEMCNYTSGNADNDYIVSTGYKYGYGDLVSQGYVATGAIDANAASAAAAAGNMGSAIPEPSSGLLLLMGGALLALRRRRQK